MGGRRMGGWHTLNNTESLKSVFSDNILQLPGKCHAQLFDGPPYKSVKSFGEKTEWINLLSDRPPLTESTVFVERQKKKEKEEKIWGIIAHIGFILAFASSIHNNKQRTIAPTHS
jgi:hypothetical protein